MDYNQERFPKHWNIIPLPDLFDINPRKNINQSISDETLLYFAPMPALDADNGSIINPEYQPYGKLKKGYTFFQKDDVIMAKITPCMENGKAAIIGDIPFGIGFGSTEFHVFRSKGRINPAFLYHYLRQTSFRKFAEEEMTGSVGQKRVPKSFFEKQLLPVPPIEEQRIIVAKIEKLLARVKTAKERLDRVPVIMQQFRQSVLAAACSGRLTEDWRKNIKDGSIKPITLNEILESRTNQWNEYQKQINQPFELNNGKRRKTKYIEPAQIKEQFDNILPNWWTYATVEQISSSIPGSIQSGPFGSNLLHSEFQEEGILVIGIDNVQDGYFSYGKQHRINENKYLELKKYTARPKDVLITVMATIGRCCIVPENIETAIISKHVYRITVNRSIILPEFLLLVLTGDISTCNQILTQIRGQTRPGINGEILKNLIIPVPPIQEQHKIICFVDALFNHMKSVESEVYTGKQKIEEITQSILHQAFTGKLIPLNETSVEVNS